MIDLIVSIDADGDFCGDCLARPFIAEDRTEPCKFFGALIPSDASLCWWNEYEGRFERCQACRDCEHKRFLLEKNVRDVEEKAS